jgi:hypothetical protein
MIEIEHSQLERARRVLRGIDNGFARAVSGALNRASSGFVSDMTRETCSRYHVKASEVRRALSVRRAGVNSLVSAVVARGRRRSLADYKLLPASPNRRRELQGAVKKDGLKPLGARAFLVERGGRYLPYVRKRDGGVEPFISPSIPQIVKNEETVAEAERGAAARFRKRLDHEILRLLGGLRR